MFKLSVNVYGGIKAVEKSAHPLHWTHGAQKRVLAQKPEDNARESFLKDYVHSLDVQIEFIF